MGLTVRRSDVFPVGTVVKAYPPAALERSHSGKPAGASLATATVDATGVLSFPALEQGQFGLYAEVAGRSAVLSAGSEGFVAPGSLKARIASRRALAQV